jgi:TLD protein
VLVTSAQIDQINAWAALGGGTTWHLCYKGTRDAAVGSFFLQSGFHAQCDNKGSTFFVAKTSQGKLFGGYTSRPWGSGPSCNYYSDDTAFLFSLTNNYKHTQTGIAGTTVYSVFDCASYGPTFGGGHDFYTDLRNSAYTNIGYTYACRVGTYGSDQCRNDFAGPSQLSLIELEVYSSEP